MPRPHPPFTPKTNTHLLPGDFWALPLSDGRYAAGRLLSKQAFGDKDRVGCIVALLDWVGTGPPKSEDLAGVAVLSWAETNVRAIANSGGSILGNRPLHLDGIEAPLLIGSVGETTPVWGWRTISKRAEAAFVPDAV